MKFRHARYKEVRSSVEATLVGKLGVEPIIVSVYRKNFTTVGIPRESD